MRRITIARTAAAAENNNGRRRVVLITRRLPSVTYGGNCYRWLQGNHCLGCCCCCCLWLWMHSRSSAHCCFANEEDDGSWVRVARTCLHSSGEILNAFRLSELLFLVLKVELSQQLVQCHVSGHQWPHLLDNCSRHHIFFSDDYSSRLLRCLSSQDSTGK